MIMRFHKRAQHTRPVLLRDSGLQVFAQQCTHIPISSLQLCQCLQGIVARISSRRGLSTLQAEGAQLRVAWT